MRVAVFGELSNDYRERLLDFQIAVEAALGNGWEIHGAFFTNTHVSKIGETDVTFCQPMIRRENAKQHPTPTMLDRSSELRALRDLLKMHDDFYVDDVCRLFSRIPINDVDRLLNANSGGSFNRLSFSYKFILRRAGLKTAYEILETPLPCLKDIIFSNESVQSFCGAYIPKEKIKEYEQTYDDLKHFLPHRLIMLLEKNGLGTHKDALKHFLLPAKELHKKYRGIGSSYILKIKNIIEFYDMKLTESKR